MASKEPIKCSDECPFYATPFCRLFLKCPARKERKFDYI